MRAIGLLWCRWRHPGRRTSTAPSFAPATAASASAPTHAGTNVTDTSSPPPSVPLTPAAPSLRSSSASAAATGRSENSSAGLPPGLPRCDRSTTHLAPESIRNSAARRGVVLGVSRYSTTLALLGLRARASICPVALAWLAIRHSPRARAAAMLGSAATIRCLDVITPSFIGTLKSTLAQHKRASQGAVRARREPHCAPHTRDHTATNARAASAPHQHTLAAHVQLIHRQPPGAPTSTAVMRQRRGHSAGAARNSCRGGARTVGHTRRASHSPRVVSPLLLPRGRAAGGHRAAGQRRCAGEQ